MSLQALLDMEDMALEELFHKPAVYVSDGRHVYFLSRCEYWFKELERVGVTKYLLWQEYRLLQPNGYSYTQFCHHLQLFKKSSTSSMIIEHKPAERLYIDFAGKKMSYYDPTTGEHKQAEILVVCLGYSQKSFVITLDESFLEKQVSKSRKNI
jgi:transposase